MKYPLSLLLLALAVVLHFDAYGSESMAIPDSGWRLWPDIGAAWKDDALYLPEDVDLAKLTVKPPTGGWEVLNDHNGLEITLPATVEQHFWGKLGLRPYTKDEYTYATSDHEVKNGNYKGVSWWWRGINVPASFSNKTILLHIRGMRQRAEVYVNRQLVGYDIIAETAFECDISKAVCPGRTNQLAIRITNPGGWMDWKDYNQITWGRSVFQKSHGFGGIDRGLTLTAHPPVYLKDTWVLNTASARTVSANAALQNLTGEAQAGTLEFSVIDPKSGESQVAGSIPVTLPPQSSKDFGTRLTCTNAGIWDIDSPRLYELRTRWQCSSPAAAEDERSITFGFRSFEPRGIGSSAGLYLNERRVRLYTAISWGFWGLNGLWPTPELAEKEVLDAKRLNMNMLNFHRDIGREEVLAKQDELGLLRYMEPGGGGQVFGKARLKGNEPLPKGPLDTSGRVSRPANFGQRYEEAKILRMVRQFRSHPSLVIYVVQNEIDTDLTDPRVFNLLRKMHALDPSRVIAVKSGIGPKRQAWMAPYCELIHYDDGTGYSGWRDQHTVGGPGVWRDSLYVNPDKFTNQTNARKEIVDWGEMLGSAVPDNHPLMVKEIKDLGGKSYDLADHQEIADAYHRFLDRWGFRAAFPKDEDFFADAGNKSYEFWGRVIETARLSEANDILTMSGWESTAIENHSGLVDNLRNFKGDPDLIASKLAPLLPVVKPRRLIWNVGDTPVFDLYLLNETGRSAKGRLHLVITDPNGSKTEIATYDSPLYVMDQFVYPVKFGVTTRLVSGPGRYRLTFSLDGGTPAQNSETLLVINPSPGKLSGVRIGWWGNKSGDFLKQAQALSPGSLEPYQEGRDYDLLIASPKGFGRIVHFDDNATIRNTRDEELFRSSIRGKSKDIHFHFNHLPDGAATVSLFFCEFEAKTVGQRQFDIRINGRTRVRNLDIFAEAGGQHIALVKKFTVRKPRGMIDISVPEVAKGEACFNAIRIEINHWVIAVTCGGESHKDQNGVTWEPYIDAEVLPSGVLERIRAGLPLLVLAGDESSGDSAARLLANAGAFQYAGSIPGSRASWMGNWVFVRKHPLYDGLPVDEVMKGDYQVPVGGCYGLDVDGPGVDIMAAYSRDHDRRIGAATFTARLGRGNIVFQTLLQMHPVIQQRWLQNALLYLHPTGQE